MYRLCCLVLLVLSVTGEEVVDSGVVEGGVVDIKDNANAVVDSVQLELETIADITEQAISRDNNIAREVDDKDIYSESGPDEVTEVKLRRSHRTAPTNEEEEEEHLARVENENKNSHHPDRQGEEVVEGTEDESNSESSEEGSEGSESTETSSDSIVVSEDTVDTPDNTRPPSKKRIYGLKTILLKYFILPIKKTLTFLFKEDSDTHYVMKKNDGSKRSNSKEEKVYNCPVSNVTTNSSISYIIEDDLISNMNLSGGCGAVLFYSMYCPFSVALIPHYRALTRVYPSLKLFAVEINAYSSSCLQFGAVGTPTVVLFLNSRPVKKVPGTSRNITSIAGFISNITDLKPLAPLELTPEDEEGVVVKEQQDYMLLTSLLFLLTSALYHLSKTRAGTAALTSCYNMVCKLKRD